MARDPRKKSKKKKNQTPHEDKSWKLIQFNFMPGSRFYGIFWHGRITKTDNSNNNNVFYTLMKKKKKAAQFCSLNFQPKSKVLVHFGKEILMFIKKQMKT